MAVMPKFYKIHTDGCTVELEPIYTELIPVVRCKDCLYSTDSWAKVNEKGFLICPVSGMEITDNDFCSYGERKDGDGNG